MGVEFKIPDDVKKQPPVATKRLWRPLRVGSIIHGLVDHIFPLQRSNDGTVSSRSEPRNSSEARRREENEEMAASKNRDAVPDGFYTLETLPPLSSGAQKIIDALNSAVPFVKVDEVAERKYSGLKLVDRPEGGVKLLD